MQKWDNRACSDCTRITPTQTRIARFQELDCIASPNSAKTFPCLFDPPPSPSPKKLYLLKTSFPCFFFSILPLSFPIRFYSFHCSSFNKKVSILNHHYGKVVMSLPQVSVACSHGSHPPQKNAQFSRVANNTPWSTRGVYYNILLKKNYT